MMAEEVSSQWSAVRIYRGPWVLCVIVAFLVILTGCQRSEDNNSPVILNSAAFNATNALLEIKALAAITPRHSGSPGAQKAAEHLLSRLRALGLQASLDEFAEETPAGRTIFRNVIGILPGKDIGSAAKLIILGAHYDTKSGIADKFEGANDSGSGAGVLLELARVIKNSSARTVDFLFVFFDGEECVKHYVQNDGLHGSRHLAAQLVKDGRAASMRAVIILDMVGDRDLNITIPRNSTFSLVSALFDAAEAEGTRDKFKLAFGEILDDHQPFLAARMPAIDIIDFEYGSAPGRNDYWHTPQDTFDKLSVSSLAIIGRTVLRLIDDLTRLSSAPVKSPTANRGASGATRRGRLAILTRHSSFGATAVHPHVLARGHSGEAE